MITEAPATRRFDPPPPFDPARAAGAAASALGLREYDFFRLAYRRWFGRQPEEDVLERHFARFMFQGAVPVWAMHLARQVLDAQAAGTLTDTAFDASRYRERPARPRHGVLWGAGFSVVWAVLFLMILNARYNPGNQAPVAHCWDPGMPHPVAVWSRLISDRPLPPCPGVTDSPHAPDR